jgi:protein-S-isoprenylcysteine O-methyltransferase Ste14
MSQPPPDTEQHNAGVIAPPPLIYVGFLALALAADAIFGGPGLGIPAETRWIAGGVLLLLGLVLVIIAGGRFRSAGTQIAPWLPSTALVTTGIYRFTRNPMYIGMALIYAGLSMIADSVVALVCLIPLLAVINYGVIRREERYLEVTFGEPYRAYKRNVRRWI